MSERFNRSHLGELDQDQLILDHEIKNMDEEKKERFKKMLVKTPIDTTSHFQSIEDLKKQYGQNESENSLKKD